MGLQGVSGLDKLRRAGASVAALNEFWFYLAVCRLQAE